MAAAEQLTARIQHRGLEPIIRPLHNGALHPGFGEKRTPIERLRGINSGHSTLLRLTKIVAPKPKRLLHPSI